jgi:small-conductance mechanosensitive channel
VGKLDAVLLGVAALIVLFICLLIFNPKDTLTSLVPLATIVLGFSFIFGHSAQLLFESMIFTFSTHTFDIGDLVQIDDMVRTLVVKSDWGMKLIGIVDTVRERVRAVLCDIPPSGRYGGHRTHVITGKLQAHP